jgi:hypothetical protein
MNGIVSLYTVETFLIPNRKSRRKRQSSLSWVGTGTSIKRGGVKASFTSINTLLIRLKKKF